MHLRLRTEYHDWMFCLEVMAGDANFLRFQSLSAIFLTFLHTLLIKRQDKNFQRIKKGNKFTLSNKIYDFWMLRCLIFAGNRRIDS